MDFRILELNFLYMYKLCKSKHFDVSIYDDIDIEELTLEDLNNIFNFILAKESISCSYEYLNFGEKIEDLLAKSDIENLSAYGVLVNEKLQKLASTRKSIETVFREIGGRLFIDLFLNILEGREEILELVYFVNNCTNAESTWKDSSLGKSAIDILF